MRDGVVLIYMLSFLFLKELLDNNYSVKHLISKRKVGNCEALKGLLMSFSNEPVFDEK